MSFAAMIPGLLSTAMGTAGGIMEGIGGMQNASAMGAMMQQEMQMKQNWYDLAAVEAQKSGQWVKNMGSTFGEDFMKDWATAEKTLQEWRETGKLGENMENFVSGRVAGFAQSAGKDVRAGASTLDEALAARGISKESGAAAEAQAGYERGIRSDLAVYKNQLKDKYTDQIIGDMNALRQEAQSSQLWEQYTYNKDTGKVEYTPSKEQARADYEASDLYERIRDAETMGADEFYKKYRDEFKYEDYTQYGSASRGAYREALKNKWEKEKDWTDNYLRDNPASFDQGYSAYERNQNIFFTGDEPSYTPGPRGNYNPSAQPESNYNPRKQPENKLYY